MAERERELDALLAELVATKPEPRDELAERVRRHHISAVIDDRIAQHDDLPKSRAARSPAFSTPVVLSAAAGVLVLLAGALSLRPGSTTAPEPERLTVGTRPPNPALAPAPPQPTLPPESRSVRAPARLPERARAGTASVGPSDPSSESSARGALPSTSASAGVEASDASLGAQNELFQSAVRAQRRGDDENALAQFDALLMRFPESPLASDASVRKFRTLARLGRSDEARVAASEYLARHPGGFARSEAEKLLLGAANEKGSSEP